jgi:glutathione synthase/RimK-type ligase-like ATP-grasp enzyme
MILTLTNRQDLTADFVILDGQRLGAPILRVNREDFPHEMVATASYTQDGVTAAIRTVAGEIELQDVRSIWYRRPGLPGPDRRAENSREPGQAAFIRREVDDFLAGLWRLADALWVSEPARVWAAELKVYQLEIARRIGFRIPATCITANKEAALKFIRDVGGAGVVKPVRGGIATDADGGWALVTSRVAENMLHEAPLNLPVPYIFQELVPKNADIRVTVIGRAIFAVEITSPSVQDVPLDWRLLPEEVLKYEPVELPAVVEDACRKLIDDLGLKFGAIDLVRDKDGFVFLEVNPSGQWAWLELRTGLPMTRALLDLLTDGKK